MTVHEWDTNTRIGDSNSRNGNESPLLEIRPSTFNFRPPSITNLFFKSNSVVE